MRSMTRRLKGAALAVLFSVFFWLVAPVEVATAQQAPARPGVFGEVIDVRVVNIEVVVTDRAGQRILLLQSHHRPPQIGDPR